MTASFVVAADHPCLAGHFPGRPIVPGVVLLDEVAGVLGVRAARFGRVRFMHTVRPGDVVEVAAEAGRFTAAVGGEVVAQGTIEGR